MSLFKLSFGKFPFFTVPFFTLVPSRIPREFMATTKASPTTIPLSWKPIKDSFYIHGILLGYKIQFKLTHIAGVPLNQPVTKTQHIMGPNTLTYVLTDLEIYATYRVKIWAFTRIGDGPSSETIAGNEMRMKLMLRILYEPRYFQRFNLDQLRKMQRQGLR